MTTSATRPAEQRPGAAGGAGTAPAPGWAGIGHPVMVSGAVAAILAAGAGLAVLTLLVLIGWIAAPHAGLGLTGVLRTAAMLWLIGHHVGFALHGSGRIGMLPLGLVLLPGALLWRAGRWVVRAGGVRRLRHVGYAALALALPYALVAWALAVASRSAQAAASGPQALICGFLLALVAGGLGGARALAPWGQLTALLPDRPRSVIIGVTGALCVLVVAGALLAGASLATHLSEYDTLSDGLAPGAIGSVLLLVTQVAYVPNAIVWAVSFTLGPGFAFGTGTVVAPTGRAAAGRPRRHAALAGRHRPGPALPGGHRGRAAAGPGRPHPEPGGRPAVGAGLRRRRRRGARRGRGFLRRTARGRPAGRGRPVRLAGDPGRGAGDRGGQRDHRRAGQLAASGPDPGRPGPGPERPAPPRRRPRRPAHHLRRPVGR
jgi:hypothetical protein